MLRFLRSERAVILALTLALVAQMPHAGRLFLRHEEATGYLALAQAAAYALALESAALIFVMRGRTVAAHVFAILSAATNLLYYAPALILSAESAAQVLMAVALPFAIAFYAHEVERTAPMREEREEADAPVEVYTCEYCGRTDFGTRNALSAHLRFCDARKAQEETATVEMLDLDERRNGHVEEEEYA